MLKLNFIGVLKLALDSNYRLKTERSTMMKIEGNIGYVSSKRNEGLTGKKKMVPTKRVFSKFLH